VNENDKIFKVTLEGMEKDIYGFQDGCCPGRGASQAHARKTNQQKNLNVSPSGGNVLYTGTAIYNHRLTNQLFLSVPEYASSSFIIIAWFSGYTNNDSIKNCHVNTTCFGLSNSGEMINCCTDVGNFISDNLVGACHTKGACSGHSNNGAIMNSCAEVNWFISHHREDPFIGQDGSLSSQLAVEKSGRTTLVPIFMSNEAPEIIYNETLTSILHTTKDGGFVRRPSPHPPPGG